MRLLTVTNLYPRPDEPQRGLFNAQQFAALERGAGNAERGMPGAVTLRNLCLVPEWRVWRWPAIRRWKDPFQNGFETQYLPAFYVPVIGRNSAWRTYRSALAAASAWVAACDAILATWLYPDGVAVADLARAFGKPVWIKVHGTDRFHLEARGRGARTLTACRQAAGVVCVCRFLAERMRQAGVPTERVHVVPNGVNAEVFRWRARDEAGARLPEARALRDRRVVLFVGHLVLVKGPDVMLDAWRMLRANAAADHLVVVGDGPERRALERKAQADGVRGTVIFLGSRAHDEVALWMNAADCLCLPSRSEGLPNVVIEALASGLPVVASDVGACGELLAGEECARVVAPGDPAALAGALEGILRRRCDRPALAARHAGRWSWRRNAEQLLALMAAAS
jgi:glycosyltransferase involved in cell wall biosynthesis